MINVSVVLTTFAKKSLEIQDNLFSFLAIIRNTRIAIVNYASMLDSQCIHNARLNKYKIGFSTIILFVQIAFNQSH